ncbi:MAG: pseudouridine synthase [Patescibacteria group bacterium]|nr:pseudouridine synthase [Patescibacteria group bacterium]
MRLHKKIAESGFCSRRAAEKLIGEGLVTVNGKVAEIGQIVSDDDEIVIDGKPLNSKAEKIYIALNKPAGYTCTNRRFKGEKNIFDLVDIDERLFVVGRLDKDSRGLVILTNDGDYALKATHPRYHHEKVYEVTVKPNSPNFNRSPNKSPATKISPSAKLSFAFAKEGAKDNEKLWADDILSCLKKGITSDGEFLVAKKALYLGENTFKITLAEGKKRQLRRMFGYMDLWVTDLLRTQIGKVKLEDLEEGEWQEIKNPRE